MFIRVCLDADFTFPAVLLREYETWEQVEENTKNCIGAGKSAASMQGRTGRQWIVANSDTSAPNGIDDARIPIFIER